MNRRGLTALVLVSAGLSLSLVGCATPKFLQSPEQAKQARAEKRAAALRRFDVHRDNAEYQAAMDRWEKNDHLTCEAQLRSIITRNPKHMPARQALADLALDKGDLLAAENEYRELLKTAPDDAQTHHSLGLLLESKGDIVASREHLLKAAQLAPDNTLYQLCAMDQPPAGNQPQAEVAHR